MTSAVVLWSALVWGPLPPAEGVARDPRAEDPGTRQTASSQVGEILGYEVGEERHYTLGPPEALERGEAAKWVTKLESVEASGSGRRRACTIVL